MAGASRVGEVHLHARLPAALAELAPAVRARLERETVVAVLEEVERRLHVAFGADAIIHVRHLSLAWTLGVDQLGDGAALARLADELVRDLIAAVEQQQPPARLRPRDPTIVAFGDEHHRHAARLADAADGHPPHWSAAVPPDAATAWAAVVAAGARAITAALGWLTRMERVEAALALADEPTLAVVAAAVPRLAGAVALIRARRAPVRSRDARVATPTPRDAAAVDDAPTPMLAAAPDAPAAPSDAPPANVPDRADPRAAIAATDAARPTSTSPAAPAPSAEAALTEPATGAGHSVHTAYAGLFFLVGRVMEIELAERLWAAGVDEGRALAAIARSLVDDDDPAWAWFGGAFERRPAAPAIEVWAAAEVSEGVLHTLGHRLAGLGVVTTPAALSRQLDELGRDWPADAFEPGVALLARPAAAALATIVAARLGRPASYALLRSLVRQDGRLVRTDDVLHVILPAAALDVDRRRAGLDQDPGYVPWLRRRVTLEYAGLTAM